MSEKVELTIQLPQLSVVDNDGRHWWPFDETERFYQNQPGHICERCKEGTYIGFKRGVTSRLFSMSYLCANCVTLINPWRWPNE